MSKEFTFQGFKNMKQTGSLVKSSKVLAKALSKTNSKENKLVLELGAGDGAITKKIVESLSEDAKLYAYEINEVFMKQLSEIKDSRLIIKNEDVFQVHDHFEENSVDLVVSCLPIANFSKSDKKNLLASIKKVLKEDGMFVQYQYSLLDFKMLKRTFTKVELGYCLLNLPPAFIYKCHL